MTHRLDVARGRDIVARWCALAEQRLDHLTELFETGRWRRYHSEQAFLENIREARNAVDTWQDLLTREASRDNSPIDVSWLGRNQVSQARGDALREQARRLQSQVEPPDVFAAVGSGLVASDEAPSAPEAEMPDTEMPDAVMSDTTMSDNEMPEPETEELDLPAFNLTVANNVVELTLDVASIQDRYPVLRNAL